MQLPIEDPLHQLFTAVHVALRRLKDRRIVTHRVGTPRHTLAHLPASWTLVRPGGVRASAAAGVGPPKHRPCYGSRAIVVEHETKAFGDVVVETRHAHQQRVIQEHRVLSHCLTGLESGGVPGGGVGRGCVRTGCRHA